MMTGASAGSNSVAASAAFSAASSGETIFYMMPGTNDVSLRTCVWCEMCWLRGLDYCFAFGNQFCLMTQQMAGHNRIIYFIYIHFILSGKSGWEAAAAAATAASAAGH